MIAEATPGKESTGRRACWRVPVLMIGAGVAGFVAVAADVVWRGWLSQWDGRMNAYFYPQQPWGVIVFSALSGMGDARVITGLAVAVGAWLARRRRWRELGGMTFGLVGSAVLNDVLKRLFHVPRPEVHTFYVFPEHPGYSFPSGHTMGAAVMAGLLALVSLRLWEISARRRWMLGALVAFITLVESFALVYMGVHYVSDVVAGAMLSLAWLGMMRMVLPPRLTVIGHA